MASSSSSIIGVSSVYQVARATSPSLSLLVSDKSLFGCGCLNSKGLKSRLYKARQQSVSSLITSAIATPNSILSEEAFKGLGGFGKGDLDLDEVEYESESDGAEAEAAASDDELAVTKLGLPQRLVETLAQRGITSLFPIQRAVLVPALEGRDIIARAKTGTGKTLAFGIPIIKRLTEDDLERSPSRRTGRLPRVLVLAPTRELAKQVEKEIKESAPYLSTVCVYGGVSYITQQTALQRGVDVAVGTPGRIIDLINSNSLRLGEVEFLVLDEADQMLAVGFEEDVELILEKLPSKRQSMLFSATMPTWVKKLARKYLDNPLTIDLVGDQEEKLAEGIKLHAIPAATPTSKRSMLNDLITVYAKGGKTIVFTQTKREADEVSTALANTIPSEPLHGDITQHQRERTLNNFRQGKFTVLVATDVAARGLDIPNVDLVIHYELPNDPETFVHRSGRTGRAGKAGTAILMFTNSQRRTIKTLERDVGCHFEFISPPSVEQVLESSAAQVVSTLNGVHPDSVEFFIPTAEKLFEEQGTKALAAAIAQLSGFSKPPTSRSLITHEQGLVTLQFTRDASLSRGYLSARSVTGFLSDVCPAAADEVGRIHIIADERVSGAVFDLPEEIAKELLSKQLPPGNSVTRVTKLPTLQDDGPPSDNYGRFNNRERSSPRGGMSRGGGRSYSGGSWGGSGRDDDRRGGGRSFKSENSWSQSSRSRSNDDWSRSPRTSSDDWSGSSRSSIPRTSSDDWLIGGRSSSRPGGSRAGFGGACFTCGKSGHRSSECPNKQGY
ncbi:hypothetical protein QQ045_023113 [Rhodiola kirilowii]